MKYYFTKFPLDEYYVFQREDGENEDENSMVDKIYAFDGPMTKEEAEILVENYNETPELDFEYEHPIIRKNILSLLKIKELTEAPISLAFSSNGPSAYDSGFTPLD